MEAGAPAPHRARLVSAVRLMRVSQRWTRAQARAPFVYETRISWLFMRTRWHRLFTSMRVHRIRFHVDQNPVEKPGMCCVQGLVNLIATTRATGGNVLIRGSHHKFPEA